MIVIGFKFYYAVDFILFNGLNNNLKTDLS